MKCSEVCERIKEIGIVPAIRVASAEDAHFAADSVARGGISIVEITMTVPEAVELISHLVRHHQKMIVGAGTVLDIETARRCIDAGASDVEHNAATLARWIFKEQPNEVHVRTLLREVRLPGLRSAEQIKKTADLLVEADWLRAPAKTVFGQPRSRIAYPVNPKLRRENR